MPIARATPTGNANRRRKARVIGSAASSSYRPSKAPFIASSGGCCKAEVATDRTGSAAQAVVHVIVQCAGVGEPALRLLLLPNTMTRSRAADRSKNIVAVDAGDSNLKAWERWVAHSGYVAEGLLYLLIGTFALLATIDASRHPNGTRGVLIRLSVSAPRKLLLAAIALGLAAYVTWQLLVAIRDPEHRGDRRHRRRALIRVEHLFNAAVNAVLVIEATRVLFGFDRGGGGSGRKKSGLPRLSRRLWGVTGSASWAYASRFTACINVIGP